MVPVALNDVIAVGEVPTAEEIDILAKAGFKSLLNTQPDGEVARFVTAAEAGRLANSAGLVYQHVPIPSRRPDDASVDAFARALASLPRPIYACCYSGARTAAAWALAAAPHHAPDSIVAACTAAGFDIEVLRAELVKRHNTPARSADAPRAVIAGGVPAAAVIAPLADSPRTPVVPLLSLRPPMPRAATAGGFAVAG